MFTKLAKEMKEIFVPVFIKLGHFCPLIETHLHKYLGFHPNNHKPPLLLLRCCTQNGEMYTLAVMTSLLGSVVESLHPLWRYSGTTGTPGPRYGAVQDTTMMSSSDMMLQLMKVDNVDNDDIINDPAQDTIVMHYYIVIISSDMMLQLMMNYDIVKDQYRTLSEYYISSVMMLQLVKTRWMMLIVMNN